MAILNFPNNPSINDTYELNDVGFRWNGTVWKPLISQINDLLVAGDNITLTYDDNAGTLTINSTGGGLTSNQVNIAIDNRVTQSFVNGLDIDADELDGQNGSYYLNYNNFTNRPTAFTNENVDDRVNELLTAGDNITLQYNDSAGTLTINSTGGSDNTISVTGSGNLTSETLYESTSNETFLSNDAWNNFTVNRGITSSDDNKFLEIGFKYSARTQWNFFYAPVNIFRSFSFNTGSNEGNDLIFNTSEGTASTINFTHHSIRLARRTDTSWRVAFTDNLWHRIRVRLISVEVDINVTGGGSNISIVGNPTDSANAGDLTKLQIGTNIYSIASGGGSGLSNENVDDRVNELLTAGDNITLTYDDAAGTLEISSTGGGGGETVTVETDTATEISYTTWSGNLNYSLISSFINASGLTAVPSNCIMIWFNFGRASQDLSDAYSGEWHSMTKAAFDELSSSSSGTDITQSTGRLYRDFIDSDVSNTSGVTARDTYVGRTSSDIPLFASNNTSEDSYPATVIYEIHEEKTVVTSVTGANGVSGGTSVEANPSGSSGDGLTRISIGGTNYNIGLSSSRHIELNDNVQMRFGNSDDVKFYYINNDLRLELESDVDDFLIRDNNTTRFTFDKTSGNFTATGDITSFSDKRLKTNIKTLKDSIDKIKKLRGVSYERIDTGKSQIGLIAQEVEEIIPEVVSEDKSGNKSIAYGNIIGLLIETIKELELRIDELERKIK